MHPFEMRCYVELRQKSTLQRTNSVVEHVGSQFDAYQNRPSYGHVYFADLTNPAHGIHHGKVWALARLGPGPFGPRAHWAQGPFGPSAHWAQGPFGQIPPGLFSGAQRVVFPGAVFPEGLLWKRRGPGPGPWALGRAPVARYMEVFWPYYSLVWLYYFLVWPYFQITVGCLMLDM